MPFLNDRGFLRVICTRVPVLPAIPPCIRVLPTRSDIQQYKRSQNALEIFHFKSLIYVKFHALSDETIFGVRTKW